MGLALRTALQFSAILLASEASIFLVLGARRITPAVLAELTETKWDYNLTVLSTLARENAEARVGVAMLLAGVILQLVNALWPMTFDDYDLSISGLIVAGAVAAVAWLGARRAAGLLERRSVREARAILDKPPAAPGSMT